MKLSEIIKEIEQRIEAASTHAPKEHALSDDAVSRIVIETFKEKAQVDLGLWPGVRQTIADLLFELGQI